MYNFTSSGLTHAGEAGARAVNSYRLGDAYAETSSGLINIDWSEKGSCHHNANYFNSLNNKICQSPVFGADQHLVKI